MEHENNNYWPGFVDALSNMVMAMIFIILTFVVVLFGAMQNNLRAVAARMSEMHATSVSYQSTLDDLRRENAALRDALAHPPSAVPGQRTTASLVPTPVTVVGPAQESRAAARTGPLPPLVSGAGDVITITYASGEASLDRTTRATLDQATAPQLRRLPALRAEILAEIAGAAAATDSQRLAYFRALEVRNYLLDRGVAPARITVRLIPRSQTDGRGRVMIRLIGS